MEIKFISYIKLNNIDDIKCTCFISDKHKRLLYRFATFICENPFLYKGIIKPKTGNRKPSK